MTRRSSVLRAPGWFVGNSGPRAPYCASLNHRHYRGSRRNQSPHGDRETSDPLACFNGVIDEGDSERAGQSDPEHDRGPLIWFSKVTRWPTSFLRAPISERTA
jgi:hypothetical protein